MHTLLCMGGCGLVVEETKDPKVLQTKLAENGYDLAYYKFQGQPNKCFIVLTNLNGEFVKGYFINLIMEDKGFNIEKELVKSKIRYKEIMGEAN